jgi:hypothetical protein
VVWDVLVKFIQNNARFGLTDCLEVHLDHVGLPSGNGKGAEKRKGRSLNVLSTIKKCIVVVKAAGLCLAHALIIAMPRVNRDPKYKSYSNGYLQDLPADELMKASGVDLSYGGSLKNFNSFRITFRTTKLLFMRV